MTPKRPHRLNWVGAMLPDGRPARHLESYGLPSRNLTAEETDALTAEQIAIARRHPDLFHEVAQPEKKAKPAATRAEAPQATESTDTGDEPTPAAEPATEGEG